MQRLLFLVTVVMSIALGASGHAQSVRNDTPFAMALHGGPGTAFRVVGRFPPGAGAELGRCVAGGQWCVASTDTSWGWLDVTALATSAAPEALPPVAAMPPSAIETTPLPDDPGNGAAPAVRPLPEAILNAVPRTSLDPVPGAAPPLLYATDRPFYNVTTGAVNLRAGPGTDHAIVGNLTPGQGGYLDVCAPGQAWCRINPAVGDPAWVKMTLVGTRRMTP